MLSVKINSYQDPDDMTNFRDIEKQLMSALAITQLINHFKLTLTSGMLSKLCLGLKFPSTNCNTSNELLLKLREEFNE